MNPLADLLWADIHAVCERELAKVRARFGETLPDGAQAQLRTMADEITIGLVARCLDAVGRAETETERARIIEGMLRAFGPRALSTIENY